MIEPFAAIIIGALALQSALILWQLSLTISNGNKLTKHCSSTENDAVDLGSLKQMHGMAVPVIKHPVQTMNNLNRPRSEDDP